VKTISRYILKEIVADGLLGLLLFTFVIFMKDVGRLLEVVLRNNSGSPLAIFVYALPPALVFTIPMGVLVGILIGMGRLGADNELVALRAAGVSARQLAAPLGLFVGLALLLAGFMSLRAGPAAAQQLQMVASGLRSSQVSFEVQPRVFIESIPKMIIYVGDTAAGGRVWRGVFVADMHAALPRITMAERGELLTYGPDSVQLHLENGASYEQTGNGPEGLMISSFSTSDIPLQLPPVHLQITLPATPTAQLWRQARFGADWLDARIELYRRFALAFACVALALTGIPLGLKSRRGGKSSGFVVTIVIVFAYYIVFITGIALARQGRVPPLIGVWLANFATVAAGIWMLARVDRIPRALSAGADPIAAARAALMRWIEGRPKRQLRTGAGIQSWVPSLIDGYVLREFLGYVALVLASFLVLLLVFTFFELLGDMIRTHSAVGMLMRYLAYLSPQLLYLTMPVSILVGVLVTFGLMSKTNEVTALKASGVSVYRLLIPVMLVSCIFAVAQFGLDATWLPGFNREQDALRATIKGRPPQTYQLPGQKWMFGSADDIYYFQLYDPVRQEFVNLSVYEFNPKTFQLTRRIFARSAHWDEHIHGWVLEDGYERDLAGVRVTRFETFRVAAFNELREQPDYFTSEAPESAQMSYRQLRRYVRDLRRSGYDVARLQVQLDKKISYPLITIIMGLLAFPFSLTVGRRGAVSGIAVAIGVAILYWVASGLLEAMGNLNQLPAGLAAWSPDLIFAAVGAYMLLNVPT
jgi:LPS export ABC transporter permease LptG/LPS export ABC transporter permease LptF